MTQLQVIILSIVEGITEFLPISSTGHMIIASALMKINEDAFTKAFEVIVQFGAILSVLVLYWRQFLVDWAFYKKLFFAFLPAAIIGLLVKNKIDALLGSVAIVGYSLVVGGVILIVVDKYLKPSQAQANNLNQLKVLSAVKIGFYQCLAFIPGVSRSAASIIGGMFEGLDRQRAAEFSFFLAVPTLTGATLVKLLKIASTIEPNHWHLLILGNIIAFGVALISIKTFIKFLTRRGFFIFGVYRIVVGTALLIMIQLGLIS